MSSGIESEGFRREIRSHSCAKLCEVQQLKLVAEVTLELEGVVELFVTCNVI